MKCGKTRILLRETAVSARRQGQKQGMNSVTGVLAHFPVREKDSPQRRKDAEEASLSAKSRGDFARVCCAQTRAGKLRKRAASFGTCSLPLRLCVFAVNFFVAKFVAP
jgi:hypothetical protein